MSSSDHKKKHQQHQKHLIPSSFPKLGKISSKKAAPDKPAIFAPHHELKKDRSHDTDGTGHTPSLCVGMKEVPSSHNLLQTSKGSTKRPRPTSPSALNLTGTSAITGASQGLTPPVSGVGTEKRARRRKRVRRHKQGQSMPKQKVAPQVVPAQPEVAQVPAPASPLPVKQSAPAKNPEPPIRSGRLTPSAYKQYILDAISPSQLSVRTLSEQYILGDGKFTVPDDVFRFRGYKKLHRIDEGAFGVVSKAIRLSDNKQMAIKEVDLRKKRAKRLEEMKRELFVLQKVEHPNIVKLVDHFVIGQSLTIIMEYCAGSNLTNYLRGKVIHEDEAVFLFRQMAIGIKVLHRKSISHRDVKLNNFLLDASRKVVKVSDFGLSVVSFKPTTGLVMAKTYCGTEPYMAPELLRRNSLGFRCYYPMYADIWSLGVCLFAMITRTFPFKMHLSQHSLYKAQWSRRWRFPRYFKPGMLSEELTDLVWHMLDPEPERRININGVLSHAWINKDQLCVLSGEETD